MVRKGVVGTAEREDGRRGRGDRIERGGSREVKEKDKEQEKRRRRRNRK
jgi:hypothetical protein